MSAKALERTTNRFPEGWNQKRVEQVLTYYENQTDEEAVMEDEAAFNTQEWTDVRVPLKLMPAVRQLINQYLQAA